MVECRALFLNSWNKRWDLPSVYATSLKSLSMSRPEISMFKIFWWRQALRNLAWQSQLNRKKRSKKKKRRKKKKKKTLLKTKKLLLQKTKRKRKKKRTNAYSSLKALIRFMKNLEKKRQKMIAYSKKGMANKSTMSPSVACSCNLNKWLASLRKAPS